MWENLTAEIRQAVVAAGPCTEEDLEMVCRHQQHERLFWQYLSDNGAEARKLNMIVYAGQVGHADSKGEGHPTTVAEFKEAIADFGPFGPHDCYWSEALADQLNGIAAGTIEMPEAALEQTMRAMWTEVYNELNADSIAYREDVARIISGADDGAGDDDDETEGGEVARLATEDLDQSYIDGVNQQVLKAAGEGDEVFWRLAAGVLFLSKSRDCDEWTSPYNRWMDVQPNRDDGHLVLRAKGGMLGAGEVLVDTNCDDRDAFKAAFRRVSDKTVSFALGDEGDPDTLIEKEKFGPAIDAAGDIDTAFVDSTNTYNLKSMQPGDEGSWRLGAGVLLISSANLKDDFPSSYEAFLRAQDDYERGTITMAKKGKGLSAGKVTVTGCSNQDAFKEAFRRVSDKKIDWVEGEDEDDADGADQWEMLWSAGDRGRITIDQLDRERIDTNNKFLFDELDRGTTAFWMLGRGVLLLTHEYETNNWPPAYAKCVASQSDFERGTYEKGRSSVHVNGCINSRVFEAAFAAVSGREIKFLNDVVVERGDDGGETTADTSSATDGGVRTEREESTSGGTYSSEWPGCEWVVDYYEPGQLQQLRDVGRIDATLITRDRDAREQIKAMWSPALRDIGLVTQEQRDTVEALGAELLVYCREYDDVMNCTVSETYHETSDRFFLWGKDLPAEHNAAAQILADWRDWPPELPLDAESREQLEWVQANLVGPWEPLEELLANDAELRELEDASDDGFRG